MANTGFLLAAGQFASLTFQNNVQGCQLQNMRWDFNPAQALPGFSTFSVLGTGFPTGFANTSSVKAYFDVQGYETAPGGGLMIHKTFQPVSQSVFVYAWGINNGGQDWIITVTLQ